MMYKKKDNERRWIILMMFSNDWLLIMVNLEVDPLEHQPETKQLIMKLVAHATSCYPRVIVSLAGGNVKSTRELLAALAGNIEPLK